VVGKFFVRYRARPKSVSVWAEDGNTWTYIRLIPECGSNFSKSGSSRGALCLYGPGSSVSTNARRSSRFGASSSGSGGWISCGWSEKPVVRRTVSTGSACRLFRFMFARLVSRFEAAGLLNCSSAGLPFPDICDPAFCFEP